MGYNIYLFGLISLTSVIFLTTNSIATQYDHKSVKNAKSDLDLQNQITKERFEQWLDKYHKSYDNLEVWSQRFEIYKNNVELINRVNSKNLSYTLIDNEFADMSREEFRAKYLGFHVLENEEKKSKRCSSYEQTMQVKYDLPVSVDWRDAGAVTTIKSQGSECGSCWSFSAIVAVEGINKIVNGELVNLSEQHLIDCDPRDNGCESGSMANAFQYIIDNHGVTTQEEYPYKGSTSTCDTVKASQNLIPITGFKHVPQFDENSLQAAVARQPVSVAINADGDAFRFYNSGIYSGPCDVTPNHGVAVIGYGGGSGGDGDEGKYWLIKNSWGTGWGAKGFLKMSRDVSNREGACGITTDAAYPTIVKN